MNQRQYDIMSMSIDAELDKLAEDVENAWYGERRNYAQTETETEGSDRGAAQAGPDEIQRLLREETQSGTGPEVDQTGPAPEGPAPRSQAPNFYGAP